MITAGTYQKSLLFNTKEKLELLQRALFEEAIERKWSLQAWAVFPNHYHLVAVLPPGANVAAFVGHLHGSTSFALNRLDDLRGRKVWFNYWDTGLTSSGSYLARLRYVHENAVRHQIVRSAADYPFCSAPWFLEESEPAYARLVMDFPIDRLRLRDDF